MPTKTDTDGVTYLEAIGQAMMSEMEADPDVFLIGEDVGQFGGAFKVTKGFLDRFGPRRVIDSPIAESGFTGLACGAALMGLRPVVEFQFADFISFAFDQIINNCAKQHYRTQNPVPLTLSAPFGARLRAGPTHSQSVEAYFAHIPGLKIVAPATPAMPPGCSSARSATTTPCCTWRASTCTGGSRCPGRCPWTRCRSGRPRWSAKAPGSAC